LIAVVAVRPAVRCGSRLKAGMTKKQGRDDEKQGRDDEKNKAGTMVLVFVERQLQPNMTRRRQKKPACWAGLG
jgi:hypothetical protein